MYNHDVNMTADTKPVAMQPNPAYGATSRKATITTANVGSVDVQANPADSTAATITGGSVAMSNPAYSESETS